MPSNFASMLAVADVMFSTARENYYANNIVLLYGTYIVLLLQEYREGGKYSNGYIYYILCMITK